MDNKEKNNFFEWREYCGEKPYNNEELEDSQEKLDIDIANLIGAEPLYEIIIEWLNRQAMITKQKTDKALIEYSQELESYNWDLIIERNELQDKVRRTKRALNKAAGKLVKANEKIRELEIGIIDSQREICEVEKSFIEPKTLSSIQEYLCDKCGEFSYMQIIDKGDTINYCSNCGRKVINNE